MPRQKIAMTLEQAELFALQAAAELEHEPGINSLLTPAEQAEAAPFYFVLTEYIRQLKEARKSLKLSQEHVAKSSGLTVESISRLETGAQPNPTWKTLGLYAIAVGRRPLLTAEKAQ